MERCDLKEEKHVKQEEETLVTALADYIMKLDGASKASTDKTSIVQTEKVEDAPTSEEMKGLRNIRDACAAIQS